MGELILSGSAALPAHLQGKVDNSEWSTLGGLRVPQLEVTAEVIKAVVGDQVVQETEEPIEIVVLKASPIGRVFYRDAYDPTATPKAPECYSEDGIVPAVNATEPQADKCDTCPRNVKGSSAQKAGSKECRYKQNLAVMLPGVDDYVFRLALSATAIFPSEKTRSGHLAFNAYGAQLLAGKVAPDMVYTQVKRDFYQQATIRAMFKATEYLPADDYAFYQAQKERPEVAQAVSLHITTNAGGAEAKPAGTQATKYHDDDLPAELRQSQSSTLRMDATYPKQSPEEFDDNDTYWEHEGTGSLFMVKANDALPQYDAFTELDKTTYTTRLKEQEAEEVRLKAEAEAKSLAEAKAKAGTTSRRRGTTTASSIPQGNEYIKDPDNYTDAGDTYWQHKKSKANVFFLPAETILPDPKVYDEILGKEKAEQALASALAEAEKQTSGTTTRRRQTVETTADTTTEATPNRRAHNRKSAEAPADEQAKVRNTRGTAGQGLASSVRDLAND